MDARASEDGAFWLAFLRSLTAMDSAAWNWWSTMPAKG